MKWARQEKERARHLSILFFWFFPHFESDHYDRNSRSILGSNGVVLANVCDPRDRKVKVHPGLFIETDKKEEVSQR